MRYPGDKRNRPSQPEPGAPGSEDAYARGAEAVELLKRVRDERVKQHGPTHPRSVAALNNLAVAYEHEGQLAKARAAYEKALALEPVDVTGERLGLSLRQIRYRIARLAIEFPGDAPAAEEDGA